MKLTTALIAATAALTFATAAPAQESSYDFGGYWDVTGIHVEDGQFENYMDHLANAWRSSMAYSQSQGWISGYTVLVNSFPRENEPDLILISMFEEWPSQAEQDQRQDMMEAHMQATVRQMDTAFGNRQTMRRIGSNSLYRVVELNGE